MRKSTGYRRQVLCAGILAISAGCASPLPLLKDVVTLPEQHARVMYHTDAERLGLAATDVPGQQVSFQPGRLPLLPAKTHSTVVIQRPHPDGDTKRALVKVQFAARADGGSPKYTDLSLWQKLAGRPAKQPAADEHDYTFREVWTMDISASEVDIILGRLEDEKFHRGPKVDDPRAFIATHINGSRSARHFQQIPDIDALIIRVRKVGKLESHHAASNAEPAEVLIQPLPKVDERSARQSATL